MNKGPETLRRAIRSRSRFFRHVGSVSLALGISFGLPYISTAQQGSASGGSNGGAGSSTASSQGSSGTNSGAANAQDGAAPSTSQDSSGNVQNGNVRETTGQPGRDGANQGNRSTVRQGTVQNGRAQPNPNGTAAQTEQNSKSVPPIDDPNRVPNSDPYGGIPSLRDLYTQVPSAGQKLVRFGSEAFTVGTGNVDSLPSDTPVGPDYVLGPGDSVTVNMWGGRNDRLTVPIDRQGQIVLPEAGTISLDGMTIAQAQAAIQKALSQQFQGEHVEISLGRVRTVRIYIVGDVQRPGAYDVSSLSTPLNVLYAAGGPTARGSLRILKHYRGTNLVEQIDLYDFLLKGLRAPVAHLLPGDTIMVPAANPQVTIDGMVHHPAIYELNGEQTLNQVLDLAGGPLGTASLKQITVARIEANTKRTMLSLDLPSTPDGIRQGLQGFKVQGGDEVLISQILPYNESAVYLEGHVFRPGRYSYREGMSVADLLHSYQDVLPEPAVHAELVRLLAPDFRPTTIEFNLRDVLNGNTTLLLKPFDVIRVFGRYDIDSPRVSIGGEVLRPGNYPLSEGMRVADLIKTAGGFNRSAFTESAGLTSYEVQDGRQVVMNHLTIDLAKAMAGDPASNVVLKPGDVVSIRQIAGWQDIGSYVTVNGELQHPGGYGFVTGEKLSSVLKRAGGYRPDAYPAAAVLERQQVVQLNAQARQDIIQKLETTPITAQADPTSQQSDASVMAGLLAQRDRTIASLRAAPVSGRLVINIPRDIADWENTAADIEVRAGDVITIPKKPDFVIIAGQVFNAAAISFMPGKKAKWYLNRAGGLMKSADAKRIYILRADGSVSAHGGGWRNTDLMNAKMQPGDTIFVPEKIAGPSQVWRDIMSGAQLATQVGLIAAVLAK